MRVIVKLDSNIALSVIVTRSGIEIVTVQCETDSISDSIDLVLRHLPATLFSHVLMRHPPQIFITAY